MTIHLENEVQSSHDAARGVFVYTLTRDDKTVTVEIGQHELDACGPMVGAQAAVSVQARRKLVSQRLKAALDE